ncbi:MAG: T9SS C-terminal target domain-containing protein [Flavobacterium sp.]|nr:MAG: T9SS C-terminal target domain-containing protein [Flavobacterium sp.]
MGKFFSHRIIIILCLSFVGMSAQSPDALVERYITGDAANSVVAKKDFQWRVLADHVSSTSDVHHIYFIQTYEGIPIIGTESSIHLKGQELVTNHYNFFTEFSGRKKISASPKIDAITALEKAVISLGKVPKEKFRMLASSNEDKLRISGGGLFDKTITPELNFKINNKNELELVWKFNLKNNHNNENWSILIDTNNGDIVETHNQILWCEIPEPTETEVNEFIGPLNYKEENNSCTECYEVFELPVENPYYGERTIVEQPWHPLASPYGWHDLDGVTGAELTTTEGNNMNLKAFNNYTADGGEMLNFTGFQLDTIFSLQHRWEEAAASNAFYVMNSLHDILYIYGFDEEARNFQKNNYGRGGLENDAVKVLTQINSGRCGSSFSVTHDGDTSTIRISICRDKDAALDSDVLIHEYVHGLTTRMVFAGSDSYCVLNNENLGEGYSDWYAKVLTIKPEETREDHQGFGNYIQSKGPAGKGTNLYHYSTDLSVNPLTYEDIANYPGDVHKIGAVWASMLWEITWNLIDEYGFDPDVYNYTGTQADAGNIRAIAIVTEALKLMPCEPGFVDARDAIAKANYIIYDGESDCLLWEGFAKRGLGIYAKQGSPDRIGDEIIDFNTMPSTAQFDMDELICLNQEAVILTGGIPNGGVYSGPGVVDNGDGRSFTVLTTDLELGTHEVIYEIEDSDCYSASSAIGFFTLVEDTEAPTPICESAMVYYYQPATEYFLEDYRYTVGYEENCFGEISILQDPPPGTEVEPGEMDINFTLIDESGNTSYCTLSLDLKVHYEYTDDGLDIELYPNPTEGVVDIVFNGKSKILWANIIDVTGRTVRSYDLSKTSYQTQLNVESLDDGVYFVKFEFDKAEIVKQLVKK